jgi:plasmid stabilization system protein ParE
MVPVIYAPEAERDIDEITAYIAKDNRKAAEQFGYRLIARAELLSTFPKLGRQAQRPCSLGKPSSNLLSFGACRSFCGDSAFLARVA